LGGFLTLRGGLPLELELAPRPARGSGTLQTTIPQVCVGVRIVPRWYGRTSLEPFINSNAAARSARRVALRVSLRVKCES